MRSSVGTETGKYGTAGRLATYVSVALIFAFLCATIVSYADHSDKAFNTAGAEGPISYFHAIVGAVVEYGDIASKSSLDGSPDAGYAREPPAMRYTWPLLNLVFMIAGATLGVLAVVMRGKKDKRDASWEFMNWDEKRYGAWASNKISPDEYRRFSDEDYPATIYRTVIKTVAVCAATIGVIVWCVTQRIVGRMVMADGYTLMQGFIAAAAGVSFILCSINKKGPDKYEYKGNF